MSKYIPIIARQLIARLSKFDYKCDYNHRDKRVEVTKGNYTLRPSLPFIKNHGVNHTADILIAKFIDYTKGYE